MNDTVPTSVGERIDYFFGRGRRDVSPSPDKGAACAGVVDVPIITPAEAAPVASAFRRVMCFDMNPPFLGIWLNGRASKRTGKKLETVLK